MAHGEGLSLSILLFRPLVRFRNENDFRNPPATPKNNDKRAFLFSNWIKMLGSN